MNDIKSKIDKFSKFFAKKQLGLRFYEKQSDAQFASVIPLKILKAQPQFEKEISEMPLEQTKVINDNIRVKPKKVSVQILLNDYTGTLIIGQLGSLFKKPEVRDTLQMLDYLIESATFMDVITLTRKFINMQLVKYDYEEGVNNKDKYLIVNMECVEIMTFETLKLGEDSKKAYTNTVNGDLSGMQKLAGKFAKVG
jgi:hypothetical protein